MKLIEQDTASILSNTSLLRGESVFTSILYYKNQFIFLDEHLERLFQGAIYLFEDLKIERSLITEIKSILLNHAKGVNETKSVRVTITEEGYFIDFRPWNESKFELDVGLSKNKKIKNFKPSFLKLSNYVLEFYELKKSKYDDLIFFDNDQLLTEATTSNVFLINQTNQIITPPVSSTVLSGILRLKLIEYLNLKGLKVWEKEISREEFLEARSIFLTNSIKGIRIINKIDEKLFEKSLILENILNEFGRYGDKIR